MIQRQYRVFLGVVASQIAWVATLLFAPSPWHALAMMGAIPAGIAILLFPHLGVVLLSTLAIGQWPWNMVRYLGLLTIASALAWLLLHRQRIFPRNALLVITCLFLLLALASVVSPKTSIDIQSQVLALAGNCAFVWLFVTFVKSRQMLRIVVRLMVLSGIVTALIGLVQWQTHFVWIASATYHALVFNEQAYQGTTAFDLQQWHGQFRIDSITGTPDYLPLYMQSLMPFVAFWIVRQPRPGLKLVGLGILGLFGVAHLLSFTRGALLTTAVVLFLSAWFIDRKRLLYYGPILSLIFAMAMMSWSPMRERLLSMIQLSSQEGEDKVHTGTWRLRTIPVAIEMIGKHPILGVGLGQQRWNWPTSAIGVLIPDPRHSDPPLIHNDYLRVPIDLGLGGLGLLLILLVTAIRKLHQLANHFAYTGDFELSDLSRGSMLAIIGIALAMPMYPIINDFRYFWVLLSLAAALLQLSEENRAAPSTAPSLA